MSPRKNKTAQKSKLFKHEDLCKIHDAFPGSKILKTESESGEVQLAVSLDDVQVFLEKSGEKYFLFIQTKSNIIEGKFGKLEPVSFFKVAEKKVKKELKDKIEMRILPVSTDCFSSFSDGDIELIAISRQLEWEET